jgi:FtsP/CotA-like multicopper oxidase with cupredoxin domain
MKHNGISRRDFLKVTGAGTIGLAGLAGLNSLSKVAIAAPQQQVLGQEHDHGAMGPVGEVNHTANGFDPMEMLTDFVYGTVTEENGRTVREWEIFALDKEIEIAPGIFFPAWTYGSTTTVESKRLGRVVGRVPGPSLRCIEGEKLRVHFINAGSHPHTIHFHGIHAARMDGVPGAGAGMLMPGERTTYEFDAFPFGCHLYHCHAVPLKRHIHKGLYGAFIIDPDPNRHPGEHQDVARSRNPNYPENEAVNEMVMIMNGFDTNFDGDNEIYAVNSIGFAYMNKPIPIRRDQLQRIYLINIT